MTRMQRKAGGAVGRDEEKGHGHGKYDLAECTARFGEDVTRFARTLKIDSVTSSLIDQLVRSAASVGASFGEADEAGTKKEFRYRVSLCKREARESRHWLQMIAVAAPQAKDDARPLWKEANELTLIFAAIHRKS